MRRALSGLVNGRSSRPRRPARRGADAHLTARLREIQRAVSASCAIGNSGLIVAVERRRR